MNRYLFGAISLATLVTAGAWVLCGHVGRGPDGHFHTQWQWVEYAKFNMMMAPVWDRNHEAGYTEARLTKEWREHLKDRRRCGWLGRLRP